MVTAKVWTLARQPKGEPTRDDFACKEEVLPLCEDGDVIVEAVCLSVDPYMRFKLCSISLNATMMGEQIARVIESKNSEWPVGSHMLVYVGWRTHTYLSSTDLRDTDKSVQQLPDLGTLPKSLGLGILGMPGNTAYLAFLEVMHPKPGETVVVNAAAGTVGSIVVQLAKLAEGVRWLVAFAGSDEKVAWLKEVGINHAFNYKTVKVGDTLAQVAPENINIYFDNVGGKFTSEVLPHMATHGRMLVCGVISSYNDDMMSSAVISPLSEYMVMRKELTIKGFVIYSWKHRWESSFRQMKKWVDEGKIQYHETVVQGFSNMPYAFIGLFRGANTGKVVVVP